MSETIANPHQETFIHDGATGVTTQLSPQITMSWWQHLASWFGEDEE